MVEDLDGVEVIMDDVIIAGEETTHDEGLMKFQEKASKKGLKTKQRFAIGKCFTWDIYSPQGA